MFSVQRSLFLPTEPCTEQLFWELVRDPRVKQREEEYRATGDAKKKRAQPAFIFQANFEETLSKSGKQGKWRKQEASMLNGLCMLDIDHVDDPQKVWEAVDEEVRKRILLAHVTTSGKGLRLVFKADLEVGNLVDNQHWLAEKLGVAMDESCKDASRLSFCVAEEDILHLDKELFTYENPAYGERYNDEYRAGHSMGSKKEKTASNENKNENEKANGQPLSYHGVEYKTICEAWQEAQGGAPAPGDRHRTMLQLALDLRYICDNDPQSVDRALRECRFVQDIIRERGEGEVTDVARSACERKLYQQIPKRMQGVLESVGIHASKPDGAAKSVGAVEVPYEQFAERLEPLLCAPYAEPARE